MTQLKRTGCCGIDIIEEHYRWDEARDTMFGLCNYYFTERNLHSSTTVVPFIIFSIASQNLRNKQKFLNYIGKYNLGTVIESKTKRNCNSGHNLRVFILETNENNIKRWFYKRQSEFKKWKDEFNDWQY